ncbi:MAG: hypothetical protein M9928_00035 [Anaerolineae bacterium]|nr:hypothetical protein [Anaerolineae bacterium]MCO5192480.1 hypothetical protein [Anaerolineae bacterium]MCO5203398.1 hypothetical protein [Anaerolineae bacterium]
MDDELIADLIESVREQRARYDALLSRLGEPAPEAAEAFLAERESAEPEADLTPAVIKQVQEKIWDATE